MAETIREYLIELGWAPEQTRRDASALETAMFGATLKANLLADALVAMARKIGDVVGESAAKFDKLYSAAQRANATAALINDFPVMIAKFGGSPTEAGAWLDAAGKKLRENRNTITVFNKLGFGLNPSTGKLEIQQEMLENLGKLNVQQIESLTTYLGMADQPILLMRRHLDEVLPQLQKYEDFRKSLGVDLKGEADTAHKFENLMSDLEVMLDTIGNKIWSGLTTAFNPVLEQLTAFLRDNAKEIGKALDEVINALVMMFLSWSSDFDKILQNPDSTKRFSDNIKLLADNIAWLTHKMADFVKVLKDILALPDVLNYLSGNTSNMASYLRGKALWEDPNDAYGAMNRAINPTADDIVKGLNEQNDAPAWDWRGAPGRFWKRLMGTEGGPGRAPTGPPRAGPTGAGPAGAPANSGAVVFGDSIGAGLAGAIGADPSNARQGIGTDWVAKRILAYPGSLAGKDVIISSGASNDTRNADRIQTQIENAIAKGADPRRITVLGVGSLASAQGNYPGASEQINATLRKAASAAGVRFQGLPSGTDVHPNYGALARSLAPPPPPAAAPAVAPAAPFRGPAPALGPFGGASSLYPFLGGGSGGDTHINAPTQTVIHVDGSGDPHAVAHLVAGAQKGVNADLQQSLSAAYSP